MADPQEYTDAQLSDGTTLRFIGQLGPDEIKQKVGRYRATKAISANPPGVPRPKVNMDTMLTPSDFGQRLRTGPNPGASEGAGLREGVGGWAGETAGDIGGGAADIAQGNVARGGHRLISGAQSALLPAAPFVAAAAPAATLRALVAGSAAGYGAGKGAELVGADPDQAALVGDIGGLVGGYAGAEAPNLTRGLGPKATAVGKLAGQYGISKIPVAGGLVRRPSYGDLLEAIRTKAPAPPIAPELSTSARTLPGQNSPEIIRPPAAPIPSRSGLMLSGEVQRPSLREQIVTQQAERRVAQRPFEGPNRRVAAEMRGFETAPPIPPERLGFDVRPVLDQPGGDLGSQVRGGTEAKFGPMKRNQKVLGQAEALRDAPRKTLIEQMGGKPPESITEPLPRSTWPPEAPMTPRQGHAGPQGRADYLESRSLREQVSDAAESEDRQRLGQERREWFGRNAPAETKGSLAEQFRAGRPKAKPAPDLLPGDPGYKWKMRRK